MRHDPTVVDHLRSLELEVSATGDDVRAAFRRLARQHHPDLDRTAIGYRRFVEVVKAYRALQMEMGLRPNMAHYRQCPRCGHYSELLEGSDGRLGCPECLLGIMDKSRFLPLPTFVMVRHAATFALYAVSIVCAMLYVSCDRLYWAALSLCCTALGMLLVFVACMTVPEVVSGPGRQPHPLHAAHTRRKRPSPQHGAQHVE